MHYKKHSRELMRKGNRENILNLIQKHKEISRADLARLTNMSPTSVSRIANELIELDLLVEMEVQDDPNKVGRKPLLLQINPNSYYAVAVEINQTLSSVNIIDIDGNILLQKQEKHGLHELEWNDLLDRVSVLIVKSIKQMDINMSKISGIGIGIPGIIDVDKGTILSSPQLDWKDVPVKNYLEKKLKITTTVDHLTKLKALGETLYGSVEDSSLTVLITFGTGVGSALIINGKIYRGHTNSAGEIGHITINENGMLCECGRRGCLQTYLTERALIQEARMFKDIRSVEEIFHYALNNEKWATSIISKLYKYIGVSLCTVIHLYNPDTIILGGELIEKMEVLGDYKKRIIDKVEDQLWMPFQGTFEVKTSKVGKNAGMLAIASVILDNHIYKII